MKNEIDLRYLLLEVKRKAFVVSLIAILTAAFFSFYSYRSTTARASGATYASTFVINIDNYKGAGGEGQQFDEYAERYFSLIASDDVLSNVIVTDPISDYVSDIVSLRNMIFFKSNTQGLSVNVYVQSLEQSISNQICQALEENAMKYLVSNGYNVSVSQHTYDLGSTLIANSSVNGKDFITITHPAVPVMSIWVLIKGFLAGLIMGVILGFVIVSLLYIVKGEVAYSGELKNIGYEMPIVDLNKKNPDFEKAINSIRLLIDQNDELALFLYGLSGATECIVSKEAIGCKSCIVTDDNTTLRRSIASDNTKVVLVLEADTLRYEEAMNLRLMMNNIGANTIAVLFLNK